MKLLYSVEDVRVWRRAQGSVGIVPTMGYLHGGHLSLVRAAQHSSAATLVTIFVNPTQFAAGEDFSAYPRDTERDLTMLRAAGVDAVFMPDATTMYPPRFQTSVVLGEVTQGKEGERRPGHFTGVATIVCKLFNIAQPDYAVFGQKDAQQVAVVRRMAADLNMTTQIIVCPIVREADGLAMSSRNVYLTAPERAAASVIHRALQTAGEAYERGERDARRLVAQAQGVLATEPLARVDYVDLSDARTLNPVLTAGAAPLLLSTAVQIGRPRLLDNVLLPLSLNTQAGATQVLGA